MSKKSKKRANVIQRHHLSYQPEKIVRIFRKEHWLLTYLGRLNPISKGLIRALRYWIKENKKRAIKINGELKNEKITIKNRAIKI